MPKKSVKKIKKNNKSNKRNKKSLKYKLSKKKYNDLIINKKSKKISKKNNKVLESELEKKYCKCIKTLKKKYSKRSKLNKGKFGICMNSIYKQRKFTPPYNVSNKCKEYYIN